jgi:hypothetical protein
MEATYSYETSTDFQQITRRYITVCMTLTLRYSSACCKWAEKGVFSVLSWYPEIVSEEMRNWVNGRETLHGTLLRGRDEKLGPAKYDTFYAVESNSAVWIIWVPEYTFESPLPHVHLNGVFSFAHTLYNSFVDKPIVAQPVDAFHGTRIFLQYSTELTSEPSPEPDESYPHSLAILWRIYAMQEL